MHLRSRSVRLLRRLLRVVPAWAAFFVAPLTLHAQAIHAVSVLGRRVDQLSLSELSVTAAEIIGRLERSPTAWRPFLWPIKQVLMFATFINR